MACVLKIHVVPSFLLLCCQSRRRSPPKYDDFYQKAYKSIPVTYGPAVIGSVGPRVNAIKTIRNFGKMSLCIWACRHGVGLVIKHTPSPKSWIPLSLLYLTQAYYSTTASYGMHTQKPTKLGCASRLHSPGQQPASYSAANSSAQRVSRCACHMGILHLK